MTLWFLIHRWSIEMVVIAVLLVVVVPVRI